MKKNLTTSHASEVVLAATRHDAKFGSNEEQRRSKTIKNNIKAEEMKFTKMSILYRPKYIKI